LFSNSFPFALEPAPKVADLVLLALEDRPDKAALPPAEKLGLAQVLR
jgi:hypothetical protein